MNRGQTALAPNEAADRLGVSQRTVYRLLRAGKLPAARVGGQWRIHPEALDAMLRGCEEKGGHYEASNMPGA